MFSYSHGQNSHRILINKRMEREHVTREERKLRNIGGRDFRVRKTERIDRRKREERTETQLPKEKKEKN